MSSILCKKVLPFFSVICLLCIAFNVNGQTITISPSSITVEMIGGDVLTRNLTFSHDGNSDMTCYLSFEILPEGEGINISFSVGDSFVLKPGDTVINITINVSHSIMPSIYTINIYADAEGTAPDENGGSKSKTYSGGSTIIIPDPIDDPPADEEPSDPVDETPDDTLLLDDTPPESDPQPSWVHRYYIPIILIALVITIIITLLILYGIERRKKEK